MTAPGVGSGMVRLECRIAVAVNGLGPVVSEELFQVEVGLEKVRVMVVFWSTPVGANLMTEDWMEEGGWRLLAGCSSMVMRA